MREQVWIDVGAHLGENTLEVAQADPSLRVYAFEPMLHYAIPLACRSPKNYIVFPMAVGEKNGPSDFHLNSCPAASSLLPLDPAGVEAWVGADPIQVVETVTVPVIRLDTFMDLAEIEHVDYLKIDAQGGDLSVVRSAGKRLRNIAKILLEVQVMPVGLYAGGSKKSDVVEFLTQSGFMLESCYKQSANQEENLTFCRL